MIVGEKVIFHGLTRESTPKILEWSNDVEMKFYTGTIYPISEFEHEEWIKKRAMDPINKHFVIEDKSRKVDIGIIGTKNMDYINRNVELYISIGDPAYRLEKKYGSGFGFDAIQTMCEFCFDSLNMHKVSARIFEYNISSIKCFEKAGFQLEGRLRQNHYIRGKYYDLLEYGLLR